MTETPAGPFEHLRLELRRGALVLAVLGQLRREHYGYTLRKALADRGLPVDEGTLYPLLRRLERGGLLASRWRESPSGPPRKYYSLTSAGRKQMDRKSIQWEALALSIQALKRSEGDAESRPSGRKMNVELKTAGGGSR